MFASDVLKAHVRHSKASKAQQDKQSQHGKSKQDKASKQDKGSNQNKAKQSKARNCLGSNIPWTVHMCVVAAWGSNMKVDDESAFH